MLCDCHKVEKRETGRQELQWVKDGGDLGPDLSNYGSAAWLDRAMIMNPGHKIRYGDNNLMPTFRNTDGPGSESLLQESREANPSPAGTKEIRFSICRTSIER